ncbi:BrxA/BrxB family bacilliredoxin [[Brevibacterium] frigoritolerans]|uniref:BrxA/BrxB family bacilliredoxin n=1 Tax=Peribacillus frigoritolerans TaxID=450367 RepID=A0A941J876_9BACI|nr:BrxA/BrxB family bacilliredoxin [Peribacillus frigoritolerans]
MAYDEYMKQMVKPMRAELVQAGFDELESAEAVENFMESVEGTTLVVEFSLRLCCRVSLSSCYSSRTQADNKPDHLVTVFAGQDKEATAKMREYFDGIEPSSPSMALLKGKEVVHFIPRHDIEGQPMEAIMENLLAAFSK